MAVKDLSSFVQSVISTGASVNSQAKLAGVDPTELRRLVIAHPEYLAAARAGRIRQKPRRTAAELRETPAVMAVAAGESIASVASRFGLYEGTLRNHVKRAFEGRKLRDAREAAVVCSPDQGYSVSGTLGATKQSQLPLICWEAIGDHGDDWEVKAENAETWYPCPVPTSESAFVLRVEGDSMVAPAGSARSYPEGSLIFVDPEKKEPKNGDRIVAIIKDSGAPTFKIFKNEDGRRWLLPLNPLHEPIRTAFDVVGTVVGAWID